MRSMAPVAAMSSSRRRCPPAQRAWGLGRGSCGLQRRYCAERGREWPTGAAGGVCPGISSSGTHAVGDDGVGVFAVGATGAGANGDSTSNDGGVEDSAGASSGAPGGPASGARTTGERGQPRGRVASEIFTQEELKTLFIEELRVTLGLSARQSAASGV